MGNQIDSGIGRSAREIFSPNQPTAHAGFQNFGIHMAMVVDDIDEMSMGRVWVYIPGVSARNSSIQYARYSPTRNPPNNDGTPGTPMEEKRAGFVRAFPLASHAGSDRLREDANRPDGRNPASGQSNGYGDFVQARNGDQVAVCFIGGDPSRAYIMGHIPKTGETSHLPSYSPQQTNASGTGYSTNIGPAYEKGPDNSSFIPSSGLFHNLTDSGLIQDSLRGAGSSSSTRETPSRVRGIKTPGDPDENMMGHQFVMDDHPDSQLMRLRTSKGAQVLLCDTGDFIYLSTCTGKTWVQIDDSGNVNVFAHSSVSVHSEADINLVCDRDFNLQVGGNANWIIKGDTRIRCYGGANITVGEGGGDLDITTIHNLHVKTQGEIRVGAKTGFTAKSADFMNLQAAKDITIKTATDIDTDSKNMNFKIGQKFNAQTDSDFNLKVGGKINEKSTGDFNMDTGGNMNATKNSLGVDDVAAVQNSADPNQADIPLEHSATSPPQTSGPPTSPTSLTKYAAPVVPQHEPWPGHPALNPGHNAAVNPSSIPKLI